MIALYSISSCFIKPYTSIRDKHSSTGKKSRNKNNEENMFSEKQKRLFFRNGSLPFLGSYNKISVTNFISSPEDIIIPKELQFLIDQFEEFVKPKK